MLRPALPSMVLACVLAAPACSRSDASSTTDPGVAADDAPAAEVHWEEFGPAALTRAADERRIILINVVATWCHWCHVMEEETYADPVVAGLLAEHFVAVRVDSDARPDIAERYRDWGWPATAVLSHDAQPILELRGYKNPRKFEALLRELIAEHEAGALERREPTPEQPPVVDADVEAQRRFVVEQLDAVYDPELGGWGRTQKYPLAQPLEHAMWRGPLHGEDWSQQVARTLDGQTKIIDPVWGGMYQYSVDSVWDRPHFEKITAIQGGALVVYATAARMTGDARWLDPARAIARYMHELMRDDRGGFYTSQDADLRREGKPAVLGHDYYALGDPQRRALGMPRIDDNVYADLNGWVIQGLCELYRSTGDPAVLADAIAATEHLLATHRTPDGAFLHGEDDDPGGLLYLRDQATMGRALAALYRVTGDRRFRDEAVRVAHFVLARLADPAGGFFAHTEDPTAVGVFAARRRPLEENGHTVRFLLELHRWLDGDGTQATAYGTAARQAIAAFADRNLVQAEGRMVGDWLMALETFAMPTVDVTIVGDHADPGVQALLGAALADFEPRAVIEVSPAGERYPDLGKPAAYLCTDTACSTPITDPAKYDAAAAAFVARVLRRAPA